MIIAAVDDEQLALEVLRKAVLKVRPETQIRCFTDPEEAEQYVLSVSVDAVFLDIQMYDIDGVMLAKQWKLKKPELNIIFTTAYTEYMAEAFRMHASGYILKPATPDKVCNELDNLRFSNEEAEGSKQGAAKTRLKIQCFGSFEVFFDGEPLQFKRAKTKELFAFLLDRGGAMCSNNEIQAALWEEDTHQAYIRALRKDLADTLESVGFGHILQKQHGAMAVCLDDSVECDYEEWKKGTPKGIRAYRGEYMSQYSWAEITHSGLN